MRWIKKVGAEVYGLFVDDGSFAVAILIWLALFWFLTAHFVFLHAALGPLLFIGLAAILVESAARRARR